LRSEILLDSSHSLIYIAMANQLFNSHATRALIVPALAVTQGVVPEEESNDDIYVEGIDDRLAEAGANLSSSELSSSYSFVPRRFPRNDDAQEAYHGRQLNFQIHQDSASSSVHSSQYSYRLSNSASLPSNISELLNELPSSMESEVESGADLSEYSSSTSSSRQSTLSISTVSSEEISSEGFCRDVCVKVGKNLLPRSRLKSQANPILEEYTCSICLDTIAGAVILDCDSGGGHAFCGSCVHDLRNFNKIDPENHLLGTPRTNDNDSTRNSEKCVKCPNCTLPFSKAISCRTLDVAIADAIQRAYESGTIGDDYIQEFRARLQLWDEKREKIKAERERREEAKRSRFSFTSLFSNMNIFASAAVVSFCIIVVSVARGR